MCMRDMYVHIRVCTYEMYMCIYEGIDMNMYPLYVFIYAHP
jgi:hypothetical protein